MNETLQILETRRSIRAYQQRQIDPQTLEAILRAGTYAPSGKDKQPAVMVVVQDRQSIAQLSRMNAAIWGAGTDPFYGAPTVVVVLADPARPTYVEDGALVLGNLMNAAWSLGVGSCWVHRAREEFASDEGKALLRQWGLPDTLEGVGHCILGYIQGEIPPTRPRKSGYIIRV